MAIAINGSGTVTGISVGGLPDGIVDRDTLATEAKGSILQVVQTVKTDTFSTANEAWADITGVSVAITPSSSSNKILINYGGLLGSGANHIGHIRLLRGSTAIFIGDQGESSQARASSTCVTAQTYYVSSFTGQFLDSPSTTSATTYKLQAAAGDQGNTVYIGRDAGNSNEFSRSRTPTFITVMEVAA